jgi:hypothetical protein
MSDNVDWAGIADSDTKTVQASVGAAAAPPPPDLPRLIGRLPLPNMSCGGVGKAILQLPEATEGVKCAYTNANTSVLSNCGNEAENVSLPAVHHSRPLNDREIEVVFAGKGEEVIKGFGWKSDPYGGQLTTRSIDFGVPFVEVEVVVSRSIPCGCDTDKWASKDYPQ